MCSKTRKELAAALRQYRHNDGTPGFVFAYETEAVDRLITDLQARIDRLSEAIARRDGLLKRAEAENTIEWQAQRSAVQRPDGTIVTADDASHTPEQAEDKPQLCPNCRQSDNPLAIYYICDGCERAWKEVENGRTDNPYAEPNVVETPEQAHEDALAASRGKAREHFETLLGDLGFEDALKYGCSGGPDQDNMRESVEIIRQALTASGVPEEVRRLPVKWRNRVDDLSALESKVAANQRGAYCKCANELEAALASASAVCDVCDGSGQTTDDECVRCGGTGAAPQAHGDALDVTIPCAVSIDPATRIRPGIKLSTLLRALEVRGMSDKPRKALTASGVPEEVRRLPEKLEKLRGDMNCWAYDIEAKTGDHWRDRALYRAKGLIHQVHDIQSDMRTALGATPAVGERVITETQLKSALNRLGMDSALDRSDWDLADHIVSSVITAAPQQSHGNALAALDEIWNAGDKGLSGMPITSYNRVKRFIETASGVPEGYKLVPVEPTEEMFWATKDHCKWWHREMGGRMPPSYEFCAEIYRSMIAAAPQRGK